MQDRPRPTEPPGEPGRRDRIQDPLEDLLQDGLQDRLRKLPQPAVPPHLEASLLAAIPAPATGAGQAGRAVGRAFSSWATTGGIAAALVVAAGWAWLSAHRAGKVPPAPSRESAPLVAGKAAVPVATSPQMVLPQEAVSETRPWDILPPFPS